MKHNIDEFEFDLGFLLRVAAGQDFCGVINDGFHKSQQSQTFEILEHLLLFDGALLQNLP